jgi:hypothetical protein
LERERVDYKFIYNNPFLSIATCYHWEKVFLIGKMASWKGSQHTFRHAPVATERRNGPYLRLMTGGHRVESGEIGRESSFSCPNDSRYWERGDSI